MTPWSGRPETRCKNCETRVGGGECLPGVHTLRLLQPLVGTVLPVPLFALPLPSRWKIVFHAPVSLSRGLLGGEGGDPRRLPSPRARTLAESIRSIVQTTLDRETEHRWLERLSRRLQPAGGQWPRGRDQPVREVSARD